MGICDGRVVIITGAGRGLGREHALAYAAEGAKVVVNDVGASLQGEGQDMSPAQEVVDLIRERGGEAITNGDDIADWDGAGRLVQSAIDTFGGLDTVVTNAGIVRDRMFVNMSVDEWDAVIRVHLRGTFCPVKHAVDYWRAESKAGRQRDGRVVTTSSGAGLHGSIAQTNYSAAKAGVIGFTKALALENARKGVTVNCIAPGYIDTEMVQAVPAKVLEDIIATIPVGRLGSSEEIADMVSFLAGERAGYVTGSTLSLNGGQYMAG